MKKHYGPPAEYFNNSEREKNFISIKRLLEIGKQHLPESLVDLLQDYPKVQTLLVGSAKPSNLVEVNGFLSHIRGDAIQNDHLTYIDISPTSLEKHAESLKNVKLVEWEQKPLRTSLVRMDMEELGIRKHSIQLILCDFTLNFAENLEGVKKTLHEFSRILAQSGIALISVYELPSMRSSQLQSSPIQIQTLIKRLKEKIFGTKTLPDPKPSFTFINIPHAQFRKLVKRTGFRIVSSRTIPSRDGNDLYMILQKTSTTR